ncbi:LysR family transcriptional regulator [Ramlibacter sp. PS4R-6]|uniref:LysR family transcriptional regulator n=1 Tax=Ramlibacter sp. PS4R-6 TaxID=3133438 RepID=UPI0030A339A1
MDRFKALQTFVAIADEGSLTRAARTLDLSLPAVVRSLAGYEAELGVRLFHRTTRRIALTEDGKVHLASARQILAAVEESELALSAGAREVAGHLTITAPVLFGQMHVAPAVTRFLREHPHVLCSVVLLDRVVNLVDEGIDVGIRIGHLEDSSLVATPLGRVRRVVCATPAFLRKHGVPRHPRDLLRFNCIRTMGGPTGFGEFQEKGRAFRVDVAGNVEFNHVLPAVQACAEGLGFGMFFSYQVAPFIASKQLKVVLEAFERPPRPIQAVYPHARLLPARTRAFIDWMRGELRAFASA